MRTFGGPHKWTLQTGKGANQLTPPSSPHHHTNHPPQSSSKHSAPAPPIRCFGLDFMTHSLFTLGTQMCDKFTSHSRQQRNRNLCWCNAEIVSFSTLPRAGTWSGLAQLQQALRIFSGKIMAAAAVEVSVSSGSSDTSSTGEEERMRRLFQTCDGDGDGFINR